METFPDMLDRIREQLPGYSNAERQVAAVVLERPRTVIDMSIAKLSAQAGVSEPTVVRFCRALGVEGFREFKLRLAQGLVANVAYVHRNLGSGDDTADYINKVGKAAVEVLSSVVAQLHTDDIETAVDHLSAAHRIEFFGFGASGVVAADAYHKFFRLGIPCSAHSDSHMQCMAAGTLQPGDVVVAISHTGRAKELIENVQIARDSGATVIGITTPHSPLARECTQVLGVEIDEDTDKFPPMVSRMAHLLLLDILVTGVTLRRGKQVTDRLRKMKKALSVKRPKDLGE
ncbi:MAG TPA: transcriptional regulator HexR [Symbiobacteriaceae bacterium]|jgi:RpiR family transcriptional regulator, carbohydrate utilization regulator|nr:transcriptional regulator HexR [Symbiobacteriaceae bacterium]